MKKKPLSKNAASKTVAKPATKPRKTALAKSAAKGSGASAKSNPPAKAVAAKGKGATSSSKPVKTAKGADKSSRPKGKTDKKTSSGAASTPKKSSPLKSAVKALGQAGKKLVDQVTKPLSKSGSVKMAAQEGKTGGSKDLAAKSSAGIASSEAKKKSATDLKATIPAKKTTGRKGKAAKKEKEEAVDDFVDTDDLLGGESEIAEYEEELQAVEELDEDYGDDDTDFTLDGSQDDENEIILTDAEGRRYCRVKDCDQIAMVDGYCRYHYLLLWRKIQIRKKILADGKLEKYVEELTARYPDKFLEMIRKDLKTEKDFLSAISELEIDESATENDFEEDTQTFIDEVRGLGDSPSTGVEDDDY
jgi:hypothetical protein